jgi:hypothetical protein
MPSLPFPSIAPPMQDIVNVIATSKKGKSRIGNSLTMAIVEQNHHDKLFVVWPELNQCRWIKKENDPDFRIIGDD